MVGEGNKANKQTKKSMVSYYTSKTKGQLPKGKHETPKLAVKNLSNKSNRNGEEKKKKRAQDSD